LAGGNSNGNKESARTGTPMSREWKNHIESDEGGNGEL